MKSGMWEVEEEALRMLRKSGQKQPPVEVWEIALNQGIELRPAPVGMSTCCAVVDGRRIIWVKQEDPLPRKRFRIAHEIFEFRGYNEKECDAGAAFLLMPSDWVISRVGHIGMDLLTLAGVFQVSHEAMAYRLSSLFPLAVTIADFHLITVRTGSKNPLHPTEEEAIRRAYEEKTVIRQSTEGLRVCAFPIPPHPPTRVILLTEFPSGLW